MWDPLFDFLSAVLWDPVSRRPRVALLLWFVVVVVTFALIVLLVINR